MTDEMSAARYRAIRKKLGLSQTQLAKRLGVVKATISAWENGKADPRLDTARQIAEFVGASVDWVLTGKDAASGESHGVISYVARGRLVPRVGDTETRVTAIAKRKAVDFVQTYFPCSAKSYALQVVGDSMAPAFMAGDVVVIDPSLKPTPGDFVHAEFSDGTSLFRRFRPQTSARGVPQVYDLVPSNNDWPTIRANSHNPCKIKGVMSERIVPRR